MQASLNKFSHGTIALLLAMVTVILLIATTPQIGLTWDEPIYIAASESYVGWFISLIKAPIQTMKSATIISYWEINHEHPPLDKVWSGLVWAVARFFLDDLTAHRLGNILLVGALVAMLYLMVSQTYGRVAGLVAVGALLSMPRFFFHAHLAALDVPVAACIFGVIFLFWLTRERQGNGWDVCLGVAWGLAFMFKINAIFILPTLFIWMVIFYRRWYLFWRLVIAGFVGLPTSIFIWPWLYHDTSSRFKEYLGFMSVDHWKLGTGVWYFGQFYNPPPWHFPFVMTLAVVPLTLTVLYFLGIICIVKESQQQQQQQLGWLFVISALVPMVALALGRSPVYDNERLYMPSFPFLAALAGIGLVWGIQGIERLAQHWQHPNWARSLTWGVVAVTFGPHLVLASNLYPHWLSYYSENVGGLSGAKRLGFETTYWCDTYIQALPYLNAHAKQGDVIMAEPYSHEVLIYYQLHGQLRQDVVIGMVDGTRSAFDSKHPNTRTVTSPKDVKFIILEYDESGFVHEKLNKILLEWVKGQKVVYQLSRQGVTLMEIYSVEASNKTNNDEVGQKINDDVTLPICQGCTK